jgi:hypothetical protein
MTPAELCQALQLKRSTFFKQQALGRFAKFELKPRIGPHRYSRKLVQQYLDREPAPQAEPAPRAGRLSAPASR